MGTADYQLTKSLNFSSFKFALLVLVEESCSIPGHNYTLPFSILAVIAKLY